MTAFIFAYDFGTQVMIGRETGFDVRFAPVFGIYYYLARNVLPQQKLTINWQTQSVPYDFELLKLNSGLDKLQYSFGFVFLI